MKTFVGSNSTEPGLTCLNLLNLLLFSLLQQGEHVRQAMLLLSLGFGAAPSALMIMMKVYLLVIYAEFFVILLLMFPAMVTHMQVYE